jgi:hypothetical protein
MPLNVLLAGGAGAPMVHAFVKAAQDAAGGGDVFTTQGPFRRAHEIDEARALTRRHDIGLIVPTIDDDLPLWAALAGSFAAEGAHVAISPASTVAMCHDRHVTCRSLNLMGIAAAPSWLPAQVSRDLPMPLWVLSRNPREGVEPVCALSYSDLDRLLSERPDAVVQQRLDGPEFEVDICCDLTGRLLAVTPSEYAELAVCIASAVHLTGPATILGTLTGDRPVVRAISPRLSTAVDVTQGAGTRVPVELVEMALERRNRVNRFGGVSAAMGAVA